MIGKFKFLFFCLALALLAGCSGSSGHGHEEKVLYEGTARKVQYDLAAGKTTVIDDQGKSHDIEGYPAMFHGKIKVSAGAHGYDLVILSLREPAPAPAEGQPAAAPAPSANEYE